jgi:hypothetical protein
MYISVVSKMEGRRDDSSVNLRQTLDMGRLVRLKPLLEITKKGLTSILTNLKRKQYYSINFGMVVQR